MYSYDGRERSRGGADPMTFSRDQDGRIVDDKAHQPLINSGIGGCYLYTLTAVSCIGGFLFGYDTGVVSGAMVLIREEWELDDVAHEMIVSSTTGLAAVGAFASGSANRIFGRKPVLVASAIIFTAGALVMAFAVNFNWLLIGRMTVGVAVGLASSTVPLFLAELAPPRLRGFLVALNNSCVVIGQVRHRRRRPRCRCPGPPPALASPDMDVRARRWVRRSWPDC